MRCCALEIDPGTARLRYYKLAMDKTVRRSGDPDVHAALPPLGRSL